MMNLKKNSWKDIIIYIYMFFILLTPPTLIGSMGDTMNNLILEMLSDIKLYVIVIPVFLFIIYIYIYIIKKIFKEKYFGRSNLFAGILILLIFLWLM
ncbi:MAG: hypothetical protein KAI16_01995 [Candidatus Pacebacteria bacterium]|nr:hypothetical protein [Candidatus Paceibacterota bacterium]